MALGTEWYWFPQQRPEEIAFLKCYDSISDGEMSKRPRYRCHLGCILLRMPAISSLAGRIYNDIQDNWWHVLDIAQWW